MDKIGVIDRITSTNTTVYIDVWKYNNGTAGLSKFSTELLATPQHCCGILSVSFRCFFFVVFAF